jgi:S-adenosylmethionine decarboxylase proenzyme
MVTDSQTAVTSADVNVGDSVTLQPYKVMVSLRFIFLTTISSVLASFAVGQCAHYLLMVRHAKRVAISDYGNIRTKSTLPSPIAKDGKDVPHTVYTAKNFDTARTASSSMLIRRDEASSQSEDTTCNSQSEVCNDITEYLTEQDEEHLPAGQHLLVDMKELSFSFLNSEERLARAMVEVVNQASLTLLSYHCHTLVPSGVSCVGVLLESHVSFHTWPEAGVITLDLFTCGSNSLLPVVPIIERLFGVPADNKKKPFIIWSHKLRGFRRERGPLQTWDLGFSVLNDMNMEYKREVSFFILTGPSSFFNAIFNATLLSKRL